jgi:nitroreductase
VSESIDLIEAMSTTRAIRRFRTDPIPDDVLRSVLEAANWAPSGQNNQNRRFLIVRDPERRRALGEIYRRGMESYNVPERLAAATDPSQRRLWAGASHLTEHLGTEPPVLVLFCQPRPVQAATTSPSSMRAWTRGSSIYAAVQNLLLAARAYGLGGCLTTVHLIYEDELKAILGIPDEIDTFALVPLGYPRDSFGPLRRRPVDEITFAESWGEPFKVGG